jgi:copper oxidase (laccase) domain-containing protein
LYYNKNRKNERNLIMFKEIDKNGVLYLVSDKLKAPHGFSTRIGGRSTNPDTASMNFGSSAEDTFVGENIKIFTDSAGLCNKTVRARQIHSAEIVRFFDKREFENIDGEGFYNTGCDGFITDLSGVYINYITCDRS